MPCGESWRAHRESRGRIALTVRAGSSHHTAKLYMNLDALYSELTLKTNAKLALIVLDGLGDLATREQGYLTPLEAADTPNLDALAKNSAQGRMIPVAPGITPGSGPGHLGLVRLRPAGISGGPRCDRSARAWAWSSSPATFAPGRTSPRSTPRALSPTAAPVAFRPRPARSFARCSRRRSRRSATRRSSSRPARNIASSWSSAARAWKGR